MHTLKVLVPSSSKLFYKLNSVSHKLKAGTKKHSCVSWSRFGCDYMDIWVAIRRHVFHIHSLSLSCCQFLPLPSSCSAYAPLYHWTDLVLFIFPNHWKIIHHFFFGRKRVRGKRSFSAKSLHWLSASSDKLAKYTQHQILTRDGKTEESGCVKSELSSLAEVMHEIALLFLMQLYLLTWIYPLESVVSAVGLLLMSHTWALDKRWYLPLSSTASIKTKRLPWELYLEQVSIEKVAEHLAKGQ